jgi:hypothetical protein
MKKLAEISYTINWVEDDFGIDPNDDNVDVVVNFETGERYAATFFTPQNIATLLERYRETGECEGGLYVWAAHMIVIEQLTKANVRRAVSDLIANAEFTRAFEELGPPTD